MCELTRETQWVREYRVNGERFLDSKYRTYDCEASADEFLAAWSATETRDGREDLVAAARYFASARGLKKILAYLRRVDTEMADRIEAQWFYRTGERTRDEGRFLKAIAAQHYGGPIVRRIVLDTPWVRAYFDGQGFSFDRPQTRLTEDEFEKARAMARTRVSRDALHLFVGLPPDLP